MFRYFWYWLYKQAEMFLRRAFWKLRFNNLGAAGEQLRYGQIKGPVVMLPSHWGASEVVKWASGRFVIKDANGNLEIAAAGDTELVGFAEHSEETTSATEGGTKTQLNVSTEAVYRIPINNGTYARTMRYKTCDLSVASDIQGVDLAASGEDVLVIVDGDEDNNNWVDVKLALPKMHAAGVV